MVLASQGGATDEIFPVARERAPPPQGFVESRLTRIDVIQRPIRQQPSQLDQLLNTQRHMPT